MAVGTPNDLQQGLGRLESLIAEEQSNEGSGTDRNEAATRFDLIDRLLLDVLRWPREQVRPEEYSQAGYADYVLGRPQRQLVLEAKREGRVFRLPPEVQTITSLRSLFALDDVLEDVVKQARGYAAEFGLPYAVVSNGHQLVAFLANRIDGVEPLRGKALVFHSLADMREHFRELWDGLSRAGVQSRRLSAMLGGEAIEPPPAKASSLIPGYPGQARTDSLLTDLRMLGELFLVDIVQDPALSDEFLRKCYLDSGALSQYASVTKTILKTRYPETLKEELQVSEIASARTRKGVPADLLSDVTAASMSARPIILLGYVGVGKTMFIRHLVRVDARAALKNAIVLYVDLLREPALEDLRPYVASHFIQRLDEEFDVRIMDRDFATLVYADELEQFARGPWGALKDTQPGEYLSREVAYLASLMDDRSAHLSRSLEFLATVRRRQIVTILDNIDQRPAAVQEEVFGLATTLASAWPGTVFVALRPDTFNRSRRSGTLKAYQPRVFAVSPPRIDRVLDKRIRFAQSLLQSGQAAAVDIAGLQNAEALNRFLEILRLSLRRSKALAELVDNLSGQNARRAIELLTTLVSSPHVAPERAIARGSSGHYSIPQHEFLRALMLGDHQRYDPGSSPVSNLLDISSTDGREHFLLPIVLSMLRRTVEPGVDDGFVRSERIYQYGQSLGFTPEQITWQLERAITNELIEPSPLDGAPELCRATTIGAYTEQKLLSDFTYLDEIAIDTPITDPLTRAVIQDTDVTSGRVQRTDRFLRYLDVEWAPLGEAEHGFDWSVHASAVRARLTEVEGRLGPPPREPRQRHRQRRRRSE